ncbi:MAG: dihydrofolate reductase [Collinsella sp.]|nr:dihydrofolate reductase [Collinsella sp.]
MTCSLKAIVAVCDDWGIGLDGGMVVANRADMRHFVHHTMGDTVIMGRKTLESFPGGRPLKGRRNIVLTRDPDFEREGVEVARSLPEAVRLVAGEQTAWVIGGAQVYREALDLVDTAIVTKNHCIRPADSFFPDLDEDPAWELASETDPVPIGEGEGDEGVEYSFAVYVRRAD